MVHHVSVIGQGIHAQRYMDALLFYPDIGNIEQLTSGQTLSAHSDIAVLAEPFSIREQTIDSLSKSASLKWILCEKLPYTNVVQAQTLIDCLKASGLYFIHTRCFESVFPLPNKLQINIQWPNVYKTGMDPLWNTLPNVMDWLFCQSGEVPRAENASLEKRGDSYIFFTKLGETRFQVTIVPADDSAVVSVDGLSLRWPNYIDIYHSAFSQILGHEIAQKENHRYTLNQIDLINRLREEQG